MSKYILFTLLFSVSFLSCKKTTQVVTDTVQKNNKNTVSNHSTSSKIDSIYLKNLEPWKEYNIFNNFIKRYEKISPNESFDNIDELKELTIALEDSLNIPHLKTPAFKSRLHVLENEVLRLDDMEKITALTSSEINLQIDKIFLIFSSINSKINTVYNQKKFESELNIEDLFTMDKKELIEVDKPSKKKKPEDIKNKKSKKKNIN